MDREQMIEVFPDCCITQCQRSYATVGVDAPSLSWMTLLVCLPKAPEQALHQLSWDR